MKVHHNPNFKLFEIQFFVDALLLLFNYNTGTHNITRSTKHHDVFNVKFSEVKHFLHLKLVSMSQYA